MERRMSVGQLPSSRTSGAGFPRSYRPATTISACARAILAYYGVDPENLWSIPPGRESRGFDIRELVMQSGHLSMKIVLPMPYGDRQMTVATTGPARIVLPGMSLSPAIAAAAIGRPIGRLTGHPAFDGLNDLVVTEITEAEDETGCTATVLSFIDFAEALRPGHAPAGASVQ